MAAISLGLVGHAGMSERLGRNARFAAIGNGIAAAAMAACGYCLSNRFVFVCTAILVAPTFWAISRIRSDEIDPEGAHGGQHPGGLKQLAAGLVRLARDRRLLVLAACVLMFHLANAATLPLMGGVVTTRSAHWATVHSPHACIVPQVAVAAFSPWVEDMAQAWGRRPRSCSPALPRFALAECCSRPSPIHTCWSPFKSSTALQRRRWASWCR